MGNNLRAMDEMKKCIDQNNEEIARQKVQIAKLEKNNRALNKKIERILFCIPNAGKLLISNPMSAELLNELFASLPLEYALGLLAKIPNWLLARNVRKMLKSIEKTMTNNKWNSEDSGPNFRILEKELVVEHLGPTVWNCIRAVSPIPSFNLNAKKPTAYFEVQILKKHLEMDLSIQIGFCTQQFPLEGKSLGMVENSIGICLKDGMFINGQYKQFENAVFDYFKDGDVVGVGIIHSPANSKIKYFSTLNGDLLGKLELPNNFATLQLFLAIDLLDRGDSIRVNFGQQKWRFDGNQLFQ